MKHDDIDGLIQITNSQKSKTVKANDTIKANDTVTIGTNHFQLAKECALCGEAFPVDAYCTDVICPRCKDLWAILRKERDDLIARYNENIRESVKIIETSNEHIDDPKVTIYTGRMVEIEYETFEEKSECVTLNENEVIDFLISATAEDATIHFVRRI